MIGVIIHTSTKVIATIRTPSLTVDLLYMYVLISKEVSLSAGLLSLVHSHFQDTPNVVRFKYELPHPFTWRVAVVATGLCIGPKLGRFQWH